MAHTESQSVIKSFADKFIKPNTQINTDESTAYDVLLPYYNLRTVNHKEEYRSDLGVTNNQAESLFSRLSVCTTDKFTVSVTNTYSNYANEIAYREDNRRTSNKTQFMMY